MKKRLTIFSLLITLLTICWPKLSRAAGPSFEEKTARLRKSLVLAQQVVSEALTNQKYVQIQRRSSIPSGPSDIRKVLNAFQLKMSTDPTASRLKYDGLGMTTRICSNVLTPLAAVVNGDPTIHICDRLFQRTDEVIAQTIIHEFAHSIGFPDECTATELEFVAMIASGRSPVGSSYTADSSVCQSMVRSLRELRREIWPATELAESIRPGSQVIFSPQVLNKIKGQIQEAGESFLGVGSSGQYFLSLASEGRQTSILPKAPFKVKENGSIASINLLLVDGNNREFTLGVSGSSQIPMKLSDLRKAGIQIVQP